MTKAERTIGTPGSGQAAGESVDDQDQGGQGRDGQDPDERQDADRPREDASSGSGAEPSGDGREAAKPQTGAAADGAEDGSDGPEASGEPDAPAARGKRRVLVLFGVAVFAYVLDLISKTLVVHHLENHPSIQLIGQYLQLEAVRNSGAAFGIGQGMTIVFTLIALIVIGVIARLARRLYSVPWAIALGLLLGGALGNLTDRVFRSPGILRGAVVDFIAPKDFAVFNLADSAIVCGGILIVWLSFRGLDPDGSVHRD